MRILSIIRIVGILVMCFSLTMLAPAFVALLYGDGGGKAFMQTFVMSAIVGMLLWWPCHHHKEELRSRDGFLIVVAFWLVLGSIGAIPFMLFEKPHLSFSSAIFESFSGLTTTGATVIEGLDQLPKAILFYRQLLQWLGGMGIIVLAVAIIPLLGIGGTQLYRAESSGPLKEQKLRPRIAEVAKLLWILYFSLTVLCAIAYWFAGMNAFDAIGHSFSTVANGGFSTHDASMGYFNNATVYLITTFFMLIAGVNFNLHISALTYLGKQSLWKNYWKDPEFRFFVAIQVLFILLFSLSLYFYDVLTNLSDAFIQGSLQLTSMSMTAGYSIFDMNNLPAFSAMLLVIASVIGGCGGSTTGGLKTIRVLILWLQVKRELRSLVHPNLVQPIKLGQNILPIRMLESIWAFLMIFILVYWVCVFAVILCGMDVFDAMGSVFATLTNAGPGLGVIHQDFLNVPESAKIVFAFAMICGRLEIFSLLVLFTPTFWKE
ncbi:TPA: potassium transporter [Pasteurella multocida]|uniref:TrkH family potassium uptake protein n=1 Tax=Pasteurella multocida TaxID=747 RepID=UPI0003548E64|nr:TrkH family potassium uptake protein [Pasteurella multocida]APB79150.1 potassium transporter [Pasteurella multocida]ATC21994.1 potassium transporter [Pasteurella multocida]EPE75229.1 TrkH protein [Pasteurella multocida 1500C]ERL41774.1 TrkH protein [Pasteurella multocida subsp. multocida str. PMTB]KEP92760.1 potassium transporter [Pasteurella multocida subsp. multocida VTCCBAA264]